MFFIVPQNASKGNGFSHPNSTKSRKRSLKYLEDDETSAYYPRRTVKACDRCRLKKARCSSGKTPCERCAKDGVICVTTSDRKQERQQTAPEYVQLVETQRDVLLRAVKRLRQQLSRAKNTDTQLSDDINKLLQELDELPTPADEVSSFDQTSSISHAVNPQNVMQRKDSNFRLPEVSEDLGMIFEDHSTNRVRGSSYDLGKETDTNPLLSSATTSGLVEENVRSPCFDDRLFEFISSTDDGLPAEGDYYWQDITRDQVSFYTKPLT